MRSQAVRRSLDRLSGRLTSIGSIVHLYRSVLKLHNSKLPAPLREMGDEYAKREFRAYMKGSATNEPRHHFLVQWEKYRHALFVCDLRVDKNGDVTILVG